MRLDRPLLAVSAPPTRFNIAEWFERIKQYESELKWAQLIFAATGGNTFAIKTLPKQFEPLALLFSPSVPMMNAVTLPLIFNVIDTGFKRYRNESLHPKIQKMLGWIVSIMMSYAVSLIDKQAFDGFQQSRSDVGNQLFMLAASYFTLFAGLGLANQYFNNPVLKFLADFAGFIGSGIFIPKNVRAKDNTMIFAASCFVMATFLGMVQCLPQIRAARLLRMEDNRLDHQRDPINVSVSARSSAVSGVEEVSEEVLPMDQNNLADPQSPTTAPKSSALFHTAVTKQGSDGAVSNSEAVAPATAEQSQPLSPSSQPIPVTPKQGV